TTELRSINNISLEYKPISKLFVNVYAGYDFMNLKDDKYTDQMLMNATRRDSNSSLAERWETTANNYNINATATYFHDVTEKHKFTYLIGGEYQQSKSVAKPRIYRQDDAVEANFYDDPNLLNTAFEPRIEATDSTVVVAGKAGYQKDNDGLSRIEIYNFISAFGRVNYAFKNKYFAQASLRTDGSSRF